MIKLQTEHFHENFLHLLQSKSFVSVNGQSKHSTFLFPPLFWVYILNQNRVEGIKSWYLYQFQFLLSLIENPLCYSPYSESRLQVLACEGPPFSLESFSQNSGHWHMKALHVLHVKPFHKKMIFLWLAAVLGTLWIYLILFIFTCSFFFKFKNHN